jgi:hypothetical protein
MIYVFGYMSASSIAHMSVPVPMSKIRLVFLQLGLETVCFKDIYGSFDVLSRDVQVHFRRLA